jgi:hypothetical protein
MTRVPKTEIGNSAARDTACDPIGLAVNPKERRANVIRLCQMGRMPITDHRAQTASASKNSNGSNGLPCSAEAKPVNRFKSP